MRFWRKRTTETKALNGKVGRLCFCKCNFDTGCVEVAFFTSVQIAAKWFLTSAQVGQKLDFGLPTKLVGGLFFIPDKLSGSWFWKFCPTWAELFFAFFFEVVLKMPFSAATTGRDFFWEHSPKCPSHRLSLEGVFQNLFQNPLINRS